MSMHFQSLLCQSCEKQGRAPEQDAKGPHVAGAAEDARLQQLGRHVRDRACVRAASVTSASLLQPRRLPRMQEPCTRHTPKVAPCWKPGTAHVRVALGPIGEAEHPPHDQEATLILQQQCHSAGWSP